MSITRTRRALRRLGAVGAAGALALTGAIAFASPAQAAGQTVTNATLRWGISNYTGAGANQPGSCNFLVAGKAGNTGSSRAWTEADGFFKTSEGNVTVVKPGPNGEDVTPTWADKCKTGSGTALTSTTYTGNQVIFSNGTGTVDPAAGTASISWTGSFTFAFYIGLTYWSATDPVLTVNPDGSGTLTATLSGYGRPQNNPSGWDVVPAAQVDLATFAPGKFTVNSTGVTVQPDYLGVEVTLPSGSQNRTVATWGAFPQSMVNFQQLTGQTSYWYSSGGAADPLKPAVPMTLSWTATQAPPAGPGTMNLEVTLPEGGTDPGSNELTWTIDGTGAVNMGTATSSAAGFVASGNLHPVTVTDTRTAVAPWSVNGQASAFTAGANSFGAQALGWTPALGANTAGAVAGAAVAPSLTAGEGLSASRTLVSAGAGATAGAATVNTALALQVPTNTPAGAYGSTLTLTLVG